MAEARKPRVLLAEDEPHCRALMKAVLTSMNCEIAGEARTGNEAVELYRKLMPNLMMLDVNMPTKSGDEVLAEVIGEFPEAFIIMLTSVTDQETIEKCIRLGASNYIRKDTPVAEIKRLIKESWTAHARSGKK